MAHGTDEQKPSGRIEDKAKKLNPGHENYYSRVDFEDHRLQLVDPYERNERN